MTNNPIEKSEQLSVEDVTSLILSYNDPNLITQILDGCGWCCSEEIIETLKVVRQDVNLGAKMTALRYLRTLLKEAAETSGIIGSVSRTVPGADGSVTTFSAKRIATALNPRKQIKIQEINNDRRETEQTDDGGGIGQEGGGGIEGNSQEHADTDDARPKASAGGTNISRNEGSAGETIPRGVVPPDGDDYIEPARDGETGNPCIQHRPPTCDRRLYPGVSGTDSAEKNG